MSRRMPSLALILLLISLYIVATANAAGVMPRLNVSEQAGSIVFYHNGTAAYGPGNGTLTVVNPASSSPLSAVNITLMNGSARFVDRIGPGETYQIDYTIASADIRPPLVLRETIVPPSLSSGAQQARLCVRIENAGDADITNFTYEKTLPAGLTEAWAAYDNGSLDVNTAVTWALDRIGPGERKNLIVAFNLTPTSGVYFPEAYIRFDYGSTLSSRDPDLAASTTTSFNIRKSLVSNGIWQVDASVPDGSEFTIDLDAVSIFRSDASDPFNTVPIASYTPNRSLDTGCSWNASLVDNFGRVPAYFIKISYGIPYTLDRRSYLGVPARTEPFTVILTPPATPPIRSMPYAPWMPTARPSPSPAPVAEPWIVFVTPHRNAVVSDNVTTIAVSMPPSAGTGYVAYYGSTDNVTWIKLGESFVSGNMSELAWSVPQTNGRYYLKAEHYDAPGLRGIAYTQVLIAHEIAPVDMTTLLARGMDWLMLLLALIALLLLLSIVIPYLRGKPVVYDSSALAALRLPDKGRPSKPSRRAIRPEVAIEGAEGINMKAVRNVEETRRLEREYGLQAYDAMALQLAREAGATLITADARIGDIGRKLGIDVKPLDK